MSGGSKKVEIKDYLFYIVFVGLWILHIFLMENSVMYESIVNLLTEIF